MPASPKGDLRDMPPSDDGGSESIVAGESSNLAARLCFPFGRLDSLPWAIRYLSSRTQGKWEDVPYDQLEHDLLWQEYGVTMHFVTLEFEDIEMERGFQSDLARRRLGNGQFTLNNLIRWSYDYVVMFLCAMLVSWVKFTLWNPPNTCVTRLGDRDVTFDRYLPTEPLSTLVCCGALCWIATAWLVGRHYRWYVSNFCMVQCIFAVVSMIAYFSHEYIAVANYTDTIQWTMEEGLTFATSMAFLAAFYSLRFIHIVYMIAVAGVVSGSLRPLVKHSVVFRRQGILGSEYNEAVLVVVSLVVLCMVVYFFEKLMRKDFILSMSLAAESELSDRLLTNILPEEVVQRLKLDDIDDHSTLEIAEGFESVSILFVEVTGLDERISTATDDGPLRLLARLLAQFDQVADKHGLEKIKSIGSTYMAVAGLPGRRSDHAKSAVIAGLEMLKIPGLSVRAGVHSGAVVAGVIGRKKFSYDVWGDAVNVASRMQTMADHGTLLVSQDTAESLGYHPDDENLSSLVLSGSVLLHSEGRRQVKGKGPMVTYTATFSNFV